MKNPFRDIEASLMRFAAEFASEHSITAVNLDAHATPTEWPSENFIGLSEMMIDLGENEITSTLAFVISTRDDTNLYEMSQLVNHLVNKLMIGNRIRVYDAAAGTPKGHLISYKMVRAGRVLNTETQPARPVFVNLISDQMLMRS
tara:strand:+ start:2470 stop:2904 length:435 start_codon:yes stop_codon:yes gene_type:complete